MTTSNIEEFIKYFSENIQNRWISKFATEYCAQQNGDNPCTTLSSELIIGKRGSGNPIMWFYQVAEEVCPEIDNADLTASSTSSASGVQTRIQRTASADTRMLVLQSFESMLKAATNNTPPHFNALLNNLRNTGGATTFETEEAQLIQTLKDELPKDIKENDANGIDSYIRSIAHLLKGLSDNDREEFIREQLHSLSKINSLIDPVSEVAREVLTSINVRAEYGPQPKDYSFLTRCLTTNIDSFQWCSLIYTYWLDEGGLLWAVERLADRIENGITPHTRPLLSVRVKESGDLPDVLNSFTHSWQQGDLAAVDERRRQYLATYGFPLHVAARWGQLETVDPNRGFAAAFHRFLATAMRFYTESRNTQIVPDVRGVKNEFEKLGKSLRESNENLRRVRPAEYRGQVEYVKQVLGGIKGQSPTNPVKEEWDAVLPGRPGVKSSVDPWVYAVDVVADLYQWRRPSIDEYLTLAEKGELLLIITRIFTNSTPPIELDEPQMWALLNLLREPIRDYVGAYHRVTGVNLEALEPFLGAPALAMAKHLPAPALPPLRRNWATELPAA